MSETLAVDLGKTGCRVRVSTPDSSDSAAPSGGTGPGAPGLAEVGGVDAAVAAILHALEPTRTEPGAVRSVVVGAAGAEAAPAAREELGRRLVERFPAAEVAVTSDAVTAHAGALDGAAGTVLAVGTGAVAVAVTADGSFRQVDGWGPWLGDEGRGAWLGREALRAVLRAHDGRGPATSLSELALARFGEPPMLPHAVAAGGTVARTCASFVPDVIAAAESGDAVAEQLVRRTAAAWLELVNAADPRGSGPVAVVGGLAGASSVVAAWRALLSAHRRVVEARGDALDGAALLARRHELPHEARVRRWPLGSAPRDVAMPGSVSAPVPAVPPRPSGAGDVDLLVTEQVRPELGDLDQRSPGQLVSTLLAAEAVVPDALSAAAPALTEAVERAACALDRGGRLIYVGAGTPGRLAALDAAECPPTFGVEPERVVAVLAGGGQAAGRAVEGAEDDAEAGAPDLAALEPTARDLVVGISASGRTPYMLAALDAARAAGAGTVAVVNNRGSLACAHADVTVELLTGAEVVSGSTRLKAGTAQKIALNVLSTGAMVRHGKTYGAWMVDVVASNEKLRRRARRILREAAGVDDAGAARLLEQAGWSTKVALVAALAGVDVAVARERLTAARGRVREAVRR
jgi:N-acetylmuramic acid 6-phosphate etherase